MTDRLPLRGSSNNPSAILEPAPPQSEGLWHYYRSATRPSPIGARALCGHVKQSVLEQEWQPGDSICIVCMELRG
jgi:hypothetical protein